MNNFHLEPNISNDEEILDWNKEAQAIIQDVKNHVKEIFVSRILKSNQFEIYLNLKTLENDEFCVRTSGSGFQIVGNGYDLTNKITDYEEENIFETPYALLTFISPGYVQSFANRLSQQIENSLL